MVQKVNFNNLTGDTLTVGNTVITGTGVTVGGSELAGGAKVYANASVLPTSGLTAGELAFTGNAMFITTGSGWYRIAVVNQDPTITLSESSISLGATGNTVFFTYTVSDPDGTTPTVTLANSGIANTSVANVNLYTANNTVRIDNFSATDWSGTITLTASDGISTAFDSLTVSVGYVSEYWDETALSIDTSSTNSLDNSTFIDRSTNAYTVTPTGSPVQNAFHPYLDNWSVDFDGAGDGLHFTGSGPADFGTGDFTVEMFVLVRSGELGYSALYNSRNGGLGFFFGLASGSRALMYYNSAALITDATPLEVERWYHVALVRNSGTTTLYKDGVSVGTYSDSFNYTSTEAEIGEDGGFAYDFDGKISNCRVIKGSALYTSNFTPPTDKLTAVTNTTLLTCQSNRFIDNSSSSLTLDIQGTPKVSAFNPFGQLSEYAVGENKGSVLFDTTSYLTAPQIPFGTADFTIEGWHFLNNRTDLYPILFSNYNSFTAGAFSLIAGHNSSTTTSYQIAWNGSFPALNAGTIKYNEWVHFAIVRNSGTVTLYINGVSVGSFSGTQTMNGVGSAVSVSYGGDAATTTQLDGYISDWTISAGTAKYTTNFTPPTSPVGNTNASLYLPMDNAGIFDKTGTNTIILGGDTSTSTTQTKYASTSIKFDGTGDTAYISGGASQKFNIGGITQWTAEFWCNTTAAGHQRLLSFHGPQNWGLIKPVAQTTGIEWNHFGPGAAFTSGAGTLPANTWTHVALVRNGSTITCYLNGTSAGSTTSMPTSGAYEVWIGSSTGTYARSDTNGYFENVQFLSGIAKYTANFTPPYQTQGRTYQATS